ncbi:MAG: competence/damage-inducible protein A [Oscillospiraceae bacterium]|nr:competence/damage-inducible protein A [Oscillospiraceae bacterium]
MKFTAEILCVGTEILLGNIVNTNATELSRGLAEVGVGLYHHTVVGDNPQRLKEALEIAFSRNNLVITTGGLGPTYDDLTKETIAAYFGRKLVRDEESERRIRAFFDRWKRPMMENSRAMPENNLKQADMPEGCIILTNHNGTAPGCIIEGENGKVAIMLPGPPREMAPMFREQVMPWLQQRSGQVLRSHNVHFFGIGESALEEQLREKMETMENPTLAPYAKDGEVMLRVTAAAPTPEECEDMLAPVVNRLLEHFPGLIYGVDVGDLQTAAIKALQEKGLTAATAESCTGGLIGKRITEVPGSSEVYGFGVVTYANEAKMKLLGVKEETLKQFGAVSEQTAAEMAAGARALSGADIAISVTGIAGPGGGSTEKPVGLVYIGVDSPWHSEVKKLNLNRGYAQQREHIRWVAASHALDLLRRTAQMR